MTTSDSTNIVVVPDLSAVELTALVKRGIAPDLSKNILISLDPNLETWDYYRGLGGKVIGGRGKRYKLEIFNPESHGGRGWISSDAVRAYFRRRSAFGHVGAFLTWCHIFGGVGSYASIPENDHCWRDLDDILYAPSSHFSLSGHSNGGGYGVQLYRINSSWCGSFLGFSELP